MSFRALVEKSPAVETKTIVHDYHKANARAGSAPRGGSPPRNPLRQKRKQSYTHTPKQMPAVAHRREIPYGRNEDNRTRLPQYLPAQTLRPAVAHRREIPYGRNENNRTRLPQSKCPRRLCAEKSPTAETKQSYTTNSKHLPAVAHRREIPYGRNENNRTRIPRSNARGGSPPRNPLRQKRKQSYTHTPKQMPAQALRPAVAHRRTRLPKNTCLAAVHRAYLLWTEKYYKLQDQ